MGYYSNMAAIYPGGGRNIAQPSTIQSPIANFPAPAAAVAPAAQATTAPPVPQDARAASGSDGAPTVAWLGVLAAFIVLRVYSEVSGARLE